MCEGEVVDVESLIEVDEVEVGVAGLENVVAD